MTLKRKRATRHVRSSAPNAADPLDNAFAFGALKTYTTKRVGPIAMAKHRAEVEERHLRNLTSLGQGSRDILDSLHHQPESSTENDESMDGAQDDYMIVVNDREPDAHDWEYLKDAPREEEVVQIRDILSMRGYRPKDERTWGLRVQNLDENWRPLLPKLVDCYLRWRYGHPVPPVTPPDASDGPSSFEIDVLDFYTLHRVAAIPMPEHCATRAEALVLSGYLGTAPLQPSLAISLKTLELFRVIRLFKASFSVEAYAKLLCHYYALQDEPEVVFTRMYAMDGNNSLKRMAALGGRQVGDRRTFHDSDYFLPTAFVNEFAHEVRSRPLPDGNDDDDGGDGDGDSGNNDQNIRRSDGSAALNSLSAAAEPLLEGGDPTDGRAVQSSCTKNWKAAASDDKKRSWGIFEETGIFASACRHGLILWLVDMIRSGELAKYPLAIVSKVLEVLGERTLGGFDIGCTFQDTVKASSLGEKFVKSGSHMCVNAFHGYSHNYRCQLRHHPNILRGIGLEDLEVMERIFSASNHLASIIRYASAYRRRVLIDVFFRHWDEEKYQNLGLMLYNNLRQALEIIERVTIELATALEALNITEADLVSYRQQELEYFEHLGEENQRDIHAVAYVETLQELNKISAELGDAEQRFLKTVPAGYTPSISFLPPTSSATTYEADTSATRKAETRRRYLKERQDVLTLEVASLEVQLGIRNRWRPGDAQYIQVMEYIATRKYHRALGHLQRLVVQRLFELHKLNLSQTGYRVRTHIAKHLQARCRAIRNAVNNYNAAAAALKPPRPPLDWSQVSHMTYVEEFELLQDTSGDLQKKKWSEPVVRTTMRLAQRLERAREEVERVNLEVRRLHTSICDEEVLYGVVLDDLQRRQDPWHGATLEYVTRRRRVNARLLVYIDKIHDLEGFTGNSNPGRRQGAVFPALLSQSELAARAVSPTANPPTSAASTSAPAASTSTAASSFTSAATAWTLPAANPPTSTASLFTPTASLPTSAASTSAPAASTFASASPSTSAATALTSTTSTSTYSATAWTPAANSHTSAASTSAPAAGTSTASSTRAAARTFASVGTSASVTARGTPLGTPLPYLVSAPASHARVSHDRLALPGESDIRDDFEAERRTLGREDDTLEEEDVLEEQATAYADFVASMM
ncbi:hypothetical protein TRAPUB_1 [Trametes pubescens]|uniref:Uncharacterized protein n=1 Tax=Trametes pubescens TaxID=154538 RepID=A0A1M2VNC5_TRAPU|nr:hypothetical protein TRAPUB_1 [Trametes pubescens]